MSCWPCAERLSSGSGRSLPEGNGPAPQSQPVAPAPRLAVLSRRWPFGPAAGPAQQARTTFQADRGRKCDYCPGRIPAAASTAPRALSKPRHRPVAERLWPPAGWLAPHRLRPRSAPGGAHPWVIPQARQQRGRIHRVAEHHNRHLRRQGHVPGIAPMEKCEERPTFARRAFGPASHITATLMLTRTSGRPSQRRLRPRSAVNSSESRQRATA